MLQTGSIWDGDRFAEPHIGILWRRKNYRLAQYRVDHPPCGITSCRELTTVAVVPIDRDPIVRNRLIDPALEIAIAHIEKIIALKHTVRRYPVAHENAEDLATNFIIGRSVRHGRHRSRDALQ